MSTYIGNSRYDLAYECLSDGFKQNYFQTYEAFEEYSKEKYPRAPILSYGNLQREGELYIIDVTVKAVFPKSILFTQTFIIKENNFNDYEIAFSV